MSTTPDQDSPRWKKAVRSMGMKMGKGIAYIRSWFAPDGTPPEDTVGKQASKDVGGGTKPEGPFCKQATKDVAADTKPEDPFRRQLFKDVAEVMAQRIKAAPAELETALTELADHERDSPALKALRRIDCEIVKQSPTHAQCTVVVALIHNGEPVLHKITRDVPWENLPQPVRADFIRSGQKTQSFVVIERQVNTSTE